MSDLPNQLGNLAFELGKVLLQTELSKRESSKLIRTLRGSDQEIILQQKIAKYWNQQKLFDRPDGLLVVTNYRLVFLTKQTTLLTETEFLSFPFEFIEDFKATRVLLVSPAIRFKVEGKVFMFTFFSHAEQVVQAIESAVKARKEH
jgi:hypothetical protein